MNIIDLYAVGHRLLNIKALSRLDLLYLGLQNRLSATGRVWSTPSVA